MILDLATVKVGMQLNDVDVYLQSFAKKSFGNEGKFSGDGTLFCDGTTLAIKIWDMPLVENMLKVGFAGKVITVSGSISEYRGSLQFVVTTAKINPSLSKLDFLPQDGVEEHKNEFFQFINAHISQPYIMALLEVFNGEGIMEAFCMEFAGSKMHDAKLGGLTHHTLKMLKLAETMVGNDDRLKPYADIIYCGIVLHDVGKVREMNLGTYTTNSFVTHRLLGCEMLAKHRDAIVGHVGETNYYHLQAIIQGHHGQWGEQPKTVWAYVVHLIDMVDSCVTGMLDKIDRKEFSEENGVKKVYMNDSNLAL